MKMICQFCSLKEAKYVCPKCNANYCSVQCYQNREHVQCSEQFYEGWVKTCLNSEYEDPVAKRRMLEILKWVHQEDLDSDDDDEHDGVPPLEERIADISLDGKVDPVLLWSRLTDDEKKEFEDILERGAEKLIPLWTPWWKKKKQPALIEEVGCLKEEDEEGFPPVCENIPPLSTLTKIPPSDNVKNDIANIFLCYVYTTRLHNGDHLESPVEATKVLTELSPVLKYNITFQDAREAVQSTIQKLINGGSSTLTSEDSVLSLLRDLISIIEGSTRQLCFEYALRVLSDVRMLFVTAKKELKTCAKSTGINRNETEVFRKKVSLLVRRTDYYLSWTLQFGFRLEELLPLINIEYTSMIENISSQLKAATTVKQSNHPLIEELPS